MCYNYFEIFTRVGIGLNRYTGSALEYAMYEQELMAALEALIPVFLGIAGAALLLGLLVIAATWRILKKSGNKGWKALIPVYADYMLIKISWKKKYFWWLIVLAFLSGAMSGVAPYLPEYAQILVIVDWILWIPILVISIKAEVRLAKAFGKGGGFAVGMILLPWIFYPILGFGKAKYRRRKRRRKKALPAPEA